MEENKGCSGQFVMTITWVFVFVTILIWGIFVKSSAIPDKKYVVVTMTQQKLVAIEEYGWYLPENAELIFEEEIPFFIFTGKIARSGYKTRYYYLVDGWEEIGITSQQLTSAEFDEKYRTMYEESEDGTVLINEPIGRRSILSFDFILFYEREGEQEDSLISVSLEEFDKESDVND